MTSKAKSIPAGALFTVTTGVYSNYIVTGVFRALKQINIDALRAEWIAAHPIQAKPYKFDDAAFLAHVAKLGVMETVECWEWHLSDYSTIDEMCLYEMPQG